MKVLWITNIAFPEALGLLDNKTELRDSGGWMLSLAEAMVEHGISLSVATVSEKVGDLQVLHGAKITYYLIPFGKGNSIINTEYDRYWSDINALVNPDVVHIHGSEFTHGLSYVNSLGSKNVVLSIQGLVSEYAKVYFAGIGTARVFFNTTLRDVVKKETLFKGKADFTRRGESEKILLRKVKNIIGRTDWDRNTCLAINPDARYFVCNELLRPEFYGKQWHHHSNKTVAVCQASYPIKGFHIFLKALSYMKDKPFVIVPGYNQADVSTIRKRLKVRSYGLLVNRLINRYKLRPYVRFAGPLSAGEMSEVLLSADAFVSSSAIENSSNAIGEAQLLGVPVIASRVGGTPSMVSDSETGYLYDFDDARSLAARIAEVLNDDCAALSERERTVAAERHCKETIVSDLTNIYNTVINENHPCHK